MNRSRMLAYGVAFAIATLTDGAGVQFVRRTKAELQQHFDEFKAKLKAQQAAGTLPEELQGKDIDNLPMAHFGMRLPVEFQTRLDLVDFLAEFWFVLAPLVFAVCLGIACLVDRFWLLRAS